jgi:hypothetical protein
LKQYPNLTELTGFPFPVYVSDGTEQRAQSIASRCHNAHEFLRSALEFDPEICVLVLTPDDWSQHATYPVYGMPHYADERTLVVAGQESDFWQSMSPPAAALPPEAAQAVVAAYGQPNSSIDLSPFFDLLAVHELGHLFQFQGKCQFPRLWLAELFCNICLHAYTVAVEPEQLPALETFPRMVSSLGDAGVRYRSLADFEQLYIDVGPQNYGWYQCRFHVAAKHIYEGGGVEALQRLWRAFLQSDEQLSDEQLAVRLREGVHPEVEHVLTLWPV